MDMNMSVGGLVAAGQNAANQVYQAGARGCSLLGKWAVTAYKGCASAVSTGFSKVVQLVKATWAHARPLLRRSVEIARSPLGLASFSVLGAYAMTTQVKTRSTMLQTLLPIAGLTLAFLGGAIAAQGNVIRLPGVLFA